MGKLPPEEFACILAGSQVVAIAERWENMSPVFALECMAAGKAIVSGAIGGIPEFIRNGLEGLLVKHDDHAAFGKAIVRLLRDRELARRLGAAAALRVQRLCTRESVRERLLEVYHKALGPSGVPKVPPIGNKKSEETSGLGSESQSVSACEIMMN